MTRKEKKRYIINGIEDLKKNIDTVYSLSCSTDISVLGTVVATSILEAFQKALKRLESSVTTLENKMFIVDILPHIYAIAIALQLQRNQKHEKV